MRRLLLAIAAAAVEIVFAGLPEQINHVLQPDGSRIASGSNGFGDHWRIFFRDETAAVWAFEHETTEHESWLKIIDGFPAEWDLSRLGYTLVDE